MDGVVDVTKFEDSMTFDTPTPLTPETTVLVLHFKPGNQGPRVSLQLVLAAVNSKHHLIG